MEAALKLPFHDPAIACTPVAGKQLNQLNTVDIMPWYFLTGM